MREIAAALVAFTAAALLGIVVLGAAIPGSEGDAALCLREANREANPQAARVGFERAAALNAHSSAPWMGMALLSEREGKSQQAEQELLQAVQLDRGYLPRWSLANFYLRRGDGKAWPLLAEALRIAVEGGQETSGLFEICWQFRPDASFVLREVVGSDAETLRLYVRFLIATERFAALREPALSLPSEQKDLLISAADGVLRAGDIEGARLIWHRTAERERAGELLTNTDFRKPVQLGFDWRYNSLPESRITFGGLARIEFTGRQPDPLELLFEFVPLEAGRYILSYDAKSSRERSEPGLFWQATDARSGALLLRRQIPLLGDWHAEAIPIELRRATLARLALRSERLTGNARFTGAISLRHPSLRRAP